MAFKRIFFPDEYASGDLLTKDLIGIGFLLGNLDASRSPNIENTVVAASIEGAHGDYRVLSMLVDWLDLHIFNVNADRLSQLVSHLKGSKERHFWCAIAQWKSADIRFKKLAGLYSSRIDLFDSGTSFQIERKGEDPRFAGTVLRIPNGSLRHRPQDVLTPERLAKIHSAYRNRILIGPTYRADMWAIMEDATTPLSPSEIARRAYGSFPTALKVKHDWLIWRASESGSFMDRA